MPHAGTAGLGLQPVAATHLGVVPHTGLTVAEATVRLREHGPNELVEGHRRSPLVILLQQFTSPLVVVLMAAAATSAVLHDPKDAIVIGVILVLNGVIGFIQEYRADSPCGRCSS